LVSFLYLQDLIIEKVLSEIAEYNGEDRFSGYGGYMDACFRMFAETAELVQADRQQLACVWQGSDATQLILLPCSVDRAPYPSGTVDSSFLVFRGWGFGGARAGCNARLLRYL
jgi:hypothetical protein